MPYFMAEFQKENLWKVMIIIKYFHNFVAYKALIIKFITDRDGR